MKKDLEEYIKKIEKELTNNKVDKNLLDEHKVKIKFYQHERLIHLIVTSLFAILTIIASVALIITNEPKLLILLIMFIVLLVPYIYHYYYLENNVQYLYKLYDKLVKHINS